MTGTSNANGHQVDKRHIIDVGVESTLARLYSSANGSHELVCNVDTSTATAPIEAFVLTNSGLIAGVTFEVTKLTAQERSCSRPAGRMNRPTRRSDGAAAAGMNATRLIRT
ncbi:hypothetical protein [Burkholderia gladioli]|uniref:hypothetical protein n=1 Tax=Burkholderia gladioli TaxID=28095 RepID=UPI00358EBAB4